MIDRRRSPLGLLGDYISVLRSTIEFTDLRNGSSADHTGYRDGDECIRHAETSFANCSFVCKVQGGIQNAS